MQELWTDNLMERFSGFARGAESEVLILSPFIKVQALASILDGLSQKSVCVITRWRTADIVSGVCDLEIFELLSKQHIPLMVHRQLHMKGIVRDQREMLIATANITATGLGISLQPNIECATVVSLQEKDKHWIEQIWRESTVVTQAEFQKFCAHIEKQSQKLDGSIKDFFFADEPHVGGFSVFELPSIATPQRLVDSLHAPESHRGVDDWERTVHDATTYGIPMPVLSPVSAMLLLRKNFFAKPIIRALVDFVASKKYFGEVKRWIQNECSDASTVTNAELIQRVQSVFNWMVELSDGSFTVLRPNYSECLICL